MISSEKVQSGVAVSLLLSIVKDFPLEKNVNVIGILSVPCGTSLNRSS